MSWLQLCASLILSMSLYLLNYKLCSTTEEKFDYANFKAPLSNIFLKNHH